MARKSPPVNRKRQRVATQALDVRKKVLEPEVLTLAQVRQLKQARQLRGGRVLPNVSGMEFGSSGTFNVYGRIQNEDYNPLFDGKNALVTFDQMDRSDGQVGAAGDIIKLPIRAAQWRCVPPENATDKEKEIAKAADESLFGDVFPPGEGWDFTLRHLLMSVTMGFGLVEKVWHFDESAGLLRWKRFAPRLPRTVDRFDVNPDGSLKQIVQYVSTPGTGSYSYKTIPAEYAILSVRERDGDNYFGKSIYRRLYKHWFYKDDAYRIDGIRLDRYGVGVPVAKIEQGHVLDEEELTEIEMILQALRSHERAYIIEPAGVTFRIMTPEGGRGGAEGLMESVNHHDSMIVRGILATFLSDHAEGLNTNRTRTLADIFLYALKGEARRISNDMRSQAVQPFCDYNFDMSNTRLPLVEAAGIGDMSPEQISAALAPLVTAQVISAEDTLEEAMRKLFGLPPLPVGWRRGDKRPLPPAPGVPAAGSGGPEPGPADPAKKPGAADAKDSKGNPIAADNIPEPSPVVVTLHNTAPQIPAQPDHSEAIRELAEAVAESSTTLQQDLRNVAETIARTPPPQPPPVVINMNGKRRTIVEKRDEHGRVQQTITEEIVEGENADGRTQA